MMHRLVLERFPARWNHLADKETLQINMLEHVPAAKPLRTLAGHALAATAAVLLHGAASVYAQTEAPPQAPATVNIEANQMEILESNKKAVFRGSVDATRGSTNLKAEELTVLYAEVKQPDGSTKTDATDLDAKGKVTIKTARETITGDWAKFNVQENKLVMGGNVKLVQGSTVLTGKELRADLDTEKIEMSGGRVKGSFLPK